MSFDGGAIGGAFALGFALAAAPGPVQMLILSETVKRGRGGRLGPTAKGDASVILDPGAWVFFATTASALIAKVTSAGGTASALAAALAVAVGVSCSDLTFTTLGSGRRRLVGEVGLRWIRTGLAALLVVIGAAFVVQGIGR